MQSSVSGPDEVAQSSQRSSGGQPESLWQPCSPQGWQETGFTQA